MHERFLVNGTPGAAKTILLAHGAGAPMDCPWMGQASEALAAEGFHVVRFEFEYMAGRRTLGIRKPPPKADVLIAEYRAAIAALDAKGNLIIGGKSMGGRIASMIADEFYTSHRIVGLLCLGYPFHPPGKPESLRTQHLLALKTPALICQGSRDPFGTRDEMMQYPLSKAIELLWLEDGDHDFQPRKSIAGVTQSTHFATMAATARAWVERIVP